MGRPCTGVAPRGASHSSNHSIAAARHKPKEPSEFGCRGWRTLALLLDLLSHAPQFVPECLVWDKLNSVPGHVLRHGMDQAQEVCAGCAFLV